jgi:thymidine phosphorylase
VVREVTAERGGWLASVDGEALGMAAARLGAGRQRKEDAIDPAVGIELASRIGDEVAKGALVARVFARDQASARHAERAVADALGISETSVVAPPLVYERIGDGAAEPAAEPGIRAGAPGNSAPGGRP